MIKSLVTVMKQDKERYKIPRSVQDVIPVQKIYKDGIFQVGRYKFDKVLHFTDINYAVAAEEDKAGMFLNYSALLNSLDCGATTKITINNRKINERELEQNVLMTLKNDEYDIYREEYNQMRYENVKEANDIVQDKYITISVYKNSVEEARAYFARVVMELSEQLRKLGSKCTELDAVERLRILHGFYRVGEESDFHFELPDKQKLGHSFKDYICPDSMVFKADYFMMGGRYGRIVFLKDYASYVKDNMIAELTELNRNMMLSIDIIPVPLHEAIKEVEAKLLAIETNIANYQRKQFANNNFSGTIPYDLEQQRKETKEFLDDLMTRDQRMMFGVITMVHTAETKEQLDADTETLLSTARKHLCQTGILRYQQMDGLNTVLPVGVRKINALRTFTTESLSVFMPFKVQEIQHRKGIFYGQNRLSKNLIMINRAELLNGNSWIFGVSGAGKSVIAKNEIMQLRLTTDADIIVIDPEREDFRLIKALGGEVITISATSNNHINALDINANYGDGANPVILKSEFLLSLCDLVMSGQNLGPKEKSIIDRCTMSVYHDYQMNNYEGEPPTLQDFRQELLNQPEKEAKDVALAIEMFTNGSLNTFAKQTNVNTKSNLICYDILELGKALSPVGMLVVLDSILNRITENRAKGRATYVFIDEIYLLLQNEYSANFLFTLWKRVRKYNAFCTGITQNVDDLLHSPTARTMLANSELIVMLNQAANDRIELANLLDISEQQLGYITDVPAGTGLLKVGSALVPFVNRIPKNTMLYKLVTTKPGETI